MSVLVIVDIKISELAPYQEYIRLITPHVHACGGRYLARGGNPRTLDGAWHAERIVVMEYPDAETAQAWLDDPEIAHIHQMRRDNSSQCNMILVDAVS